MAEPRHKRGESRQDYGTPQSLIDAVKRDLYIKEFAYDLAASPSNAKALKYYTKDDDSLTQQWVGGPSEWLWCNPPYSNIRPWVAKASTAGVNVAMLLPASVGSNWWRDYVHNKAGVWFLNGRVKFEGAPTHSPKDHAIILYGPDVIPNYHVWSWNAA